MPNGVDSMTTRVPLRLLCLCIAGCLMQTVLPASGWTQEVEWRSDYGKARQEAIDKNRPLLIDVGTEHCHFCKQLGSAHLQGSGHHRTAQRSLRPAQD